MKRLVCALSLMACGGGSRAAEVSLALPAPSAAATTPATLLGCTIVGTGERGREGEEPFAFRVFDSESAIMPALVIEHPERAHVTWSHFPARAGRGRARVGLGGQAHVRWEGFAELYGRTFTSTTRMDSVDGHLWAHAGAPIDMMSASPTGEIFASVTTPFKAPRTIVVHGNCANVIYEPNVPRREIKPRRISAVSEAPALRLFASPNEAHPFTTLSPSSTLHLELAERKDDVAHVIGDEGNIGFDAWVLASDVREESGYGRVVTTHRATPPTIRVQGVRLVHVPRDTELYVSTDDAPIALRGAIIERDAVVAYNPNEGATADGRAFVPFEFEDRFIVAPEGGRLWIAKDVVSSTP